MARAKISDADGGSALTAWLVAKQADTAISRPQLATAVRYTLQVLNQLAPGNAVEVRVPPFGAVQCMPGPSHTRGTPPNTVETDPETWLALATGQISWLDAQSKLYASGLRADISAVLPLLHG